MRGKDILLLLAFGFLLSGSSALCEEIFDLGAINADVKILGRPDAQRLGQVVAAGDVNGDGIDDIVTIEGFGGTAYVIFGDSTLDGVFDLGAGAADVAIQGLGDKLAHYPSPSAGFGDINGDDISDLIITGYYHTYVIYGGPSLPGSIDVATYSNMTTFLSTSGLCGDAAVGSGDFNQDEFDDVMMARSISWAPEGHWGPEVFVKFGGESLPDTIDFNSTPPDVHIKQTNPSSPTCPSICPADVNNDGFDDIIFSSNMYWPSPGRARCGAAYAIYGDSILPSWINLDSTTADLTIYGEVQYGLLGTGMAAGDINGDDIADLVLGAPRSVPGYYAGIAYVLYGASLLPELIDLLDTTLDVTIYGVDSSYLGAVIAAGDFNQDGYDDMLMGHQAVGPVQGISEAYAIYGASDLPSTIYLGSGFDGITIIGEEELDALGADVAFGNFNGDDFDDLLVGTSGFFDHLPPGRAYVILGDSVIHYGDPNYDKIIDLADIVYLLNYLFKSGPQPYPRLAGDANCDEVADVADVVYLLNYLFKSGPEPGCLQ